MSDPAVLDSASSADELRKLFDRVKELRDGIIEPADLVDRLRELCPSLDSWRHLISAMPLHKLSFELKAGIQRAEAIRLLSDWCESPRLGEDSADGAAEIHGFLSVLLITLITIEEGASSSNGFINDAPDGESRGASGNHAMSRHNCERTCRALTRIPSVRSVLLALYAPDELSSVQVLTENHEQKKTVKAWNLLLASSLEFHRHGSTSFILRGLPEWLPRIKFALKCVLLPYSNVPVIASKTESYATDHDSKVDKDRSVPHMVQVWASTTRWILMEFVDGVPLSDEIEDLKKNPPRSGQGRRPQRVPLTGNVRLDLIRILGLPLLGALGELHRAGKRHEDLSPSNIIVRRRASADGRYEYDITFIDFGRNYLHTGVVGGYEGPDVTFVAPEVRSNEDDVVSADLYSLGRILIAFGDVGQNRDGTIPDRFYGQAPLIARVIEDLIDEKAKRRLLILVR